jgi:hypothetical protein
MEKETNKIKIIEQFDRQLEQPKHRKRQTKNEDYLQITTQIELTERQTNR